MRHLRPWLSLRPSPCSPTARSAASSRRAGSSSSRGIPTLVQPASVDLRLGDSFRVFHNHRVDRDRPARRRRSNLTEEVVVERRRAVRHPPRRVLPRAHAGVGRAARRHRRAHRGQELLGPARADRPRHRRLLRPGLEGHADARAQQPHARADQALPRAADRAAVVHDARRARPSGPTARRGLGSHYQGQVAATGVALRGRPTVAVAFRAPMLRRAARRSPPRRRAEPSKTPFYICGGAARRRWARRSLLGSSASRAPRRSRPPTAASAASSALGARARRGPRWRPPSSPR